MNKRVWDLLDELAGSMTDAQLTELAELRRESSGAPVAWQWLDTSTFRRTLPERAVAEEWFPLFARGE